MMKTYRKPPYLAVLAALVLTACASTPEQRIAKSPTEFGALSAETQQRVREGNVAIGDSPQVVRLALGEPTQILAQETSEGRGAVWVYSGNSGPAFSIGLGIGSWGSNVGGGVNTQIPVGGGAGNEVRVVFRAEKVVAIERNQALR